MRSGDEPGANGDRGMSESELPPGEVTQLLRHAQGGSREAEARLYELLRNELRRLADVQMRGRPGHTLQPTALIHEAWLALFRSERDYASREHFLAFAARAMRSVLVDHARRHGRQKRGGDRERVPLDQALEIYARTPSDLLALDDALARLAGEDERQARVVELRFFAGMTIEETARALSVSAATVERDWKLARVWLERSLGEA